MRVKTLEADPIKLRVEQVSELLTMHAGGIDLEEITDEGKVRVRFTGMCTGCWYQPITMAATIRPALLEIDGVTDVEAVGLRLDVEAERRLADAIGGGSWWRRGAQDHQPGTD